jgi:biopolymer transport protein ExbB/TolQ
MGRAAPTTECGMKNYIKYIIFGACLLGVVVWNIILTTMPKVPDVSKNVQALEEKTVQVQESEKKMMEQIGNLLLDIQQSKKRQDSLGVLLKSYSDKVKFYDKQLESIRAAMKVPTNYRDSSKTSVLNVLPK